MYSDDELHKLESSKKIPQKGVSQRRVNYNTTPSRKALDEPEEDFYDDFYRYEKSMEEDNIDDEPDLETDDNKESRSKVGIVLLLLIILAVVGFLLTKSFLKTPEEEKPDPIANISEELIEVNENEDRKINYSFENFEDDPRASFVSSDENIATVNNEGVVHGVKEGETKVIISYFIKDVSYQKEVNVKVNHVETPPPEPEPEPEPPKPTPTPTPAKDTTKPTLTVNVTNGGDNWVNHDVVINVSGKDNSGKVTLRYALNCTSNCKYQNVSGGKITISSQGQTSVLIQAVDPSGNKVSKQVNVKIDKTAPTCSLKVSSSGTISSTISDNNGIISYYGFNSDYATDRTKSKKISSAGAYTYYLKDQAGNKGTCSINVKTKVQYRSRTCDNANKTFGSWYVRKQVYITSCGAYGKSEAERNGANWYRTRSEVAASNCGGQSPCYYCTAYARNITGCRWGSEAWGPYQDTEIASSTTVQVEKSTVFY